MSFFLNNSLQNIGQKGQILVQWNHLGPDWNGFQYHSTTMEIPRWTRIMDNGRMMTNKCISPGHLSVNMFVCCTLCTGHFAWQYEKKSSLVNISDLSGSTTQRAKNAVNAVVILAAATLWLRPSDYAICRICHLSAPRMTNQFDTCVQNAARV